MFIAENLNQFKNLFVTKLKAMLSDDELGAFILVLANSLQDDYLKNELQVDLKNNFNALKENYLAGTLKATEDDLDVFEKLLEMDVDDLPVWQSRQEGNWLIVFNIMRQLRPSRASSRALNSITQAFDGDKFHFNKPFLKPEILWQGEYDDKSVRVLYNKFPFSDYHLLIVVSPELNRAQVLDEEMHHFIYSLVQKESKVLPGFGVGFNSLAAGASVNHLHFQGFIREQNFAIEDMAENDFPLKVSCSTSSESAWQQIALLSQNDIAFNCLYQKGKCYVVPRLYQGRVNLPDWLDGAGWIDVAGVMTVSDYKTFYDIEEVSVGKALSLLNVEDIY
ncbi:MAG: hypothetical protein COA54_12895 [Thiotrichaceae bacterium]|nr:MAG: hypothetical protein COA54_12895 [Thiotrichaceae bacterium]